MEFTLKNISIRVQILLPVAFTAFALFISLWIAMSNLKSEQQVMDANISSLVLYKDKVAEIDAEMYSLRIDAVYAIYDIEYRSNFINKLEKRSQRITVLLNELKARKTFASEVDQIATGLKGYADYSRKVVDYLNKKDKNIATMENYESLIAGYRQTGDKMVHALEYLSQQVNTFSDMVMNESYAKNIQVQNTAAIIVTSVFIISLIVSWLLSGLIVRPIQQLQHAIRKLAEGNLTIRTDTKGNNEIAQLSQDVNTTAIQLQSTIEELHRINQNVASASTQLATVMTESKLNSEKELAEIEQVASAVNELSSTADNVSENALTADQTAENTNNLAKEGLEIFTQSTEASEKMAVALNDTATVVQHLQDQSEQINNVIEVIRSVSEQTNLLALNAAIEAARAGESGRGFAVVADEVRLLAARTQASTQEIQTIIEALQEQSNLANNSMQTSLHMLDHNKELTAKASHALIGITESISLINNMNTQVATAAEEQSQVTQDINRNVVNMSELVNQNVSGITQSAIASSELSRLAEEQKQQLSFFTL